MKKLLTVALAAAATLMATPAAAWDGNLGGTIQRLEFANTGNYAFRVFLSTTDPYCSVNPSGFAFIEAGPDPFFEARVAALLSAYHTGKWVRLYTTNSRGFCEIGYFIIN